MRIDMWISSFIIALFVTWSLFGISDFEFSKAEGDVGRSVVTAIVFIGTFMWLSGFFILVIQKLGKGFWW